MTGLGFRCTVVPSDADGDAPQVHPDPASLARDVAASKMRSAAFPSDEGIAVAADTLVFLGDRVFGKPRDRGEARGMLRSLAGRTHCVTTAICVLDLHDGRQECASEVTRVTFAPLSRGAVEWYLRSGEWEDKAGAYGIQGLASPFVRGIRGCYFNVVGLPVHRFFQVMKRMGVGWDQFPASDAKR